MKKIMRFNEYENLSPLIESSDPDLIQELNSLERAEPFHSVNEGQLLDKIKNSLSKFLLGPLSKVGIIDEARRVLLDLEMDIIEQKHQKRKEIEDLEDQISSLSRSEDKEKIRALLKDKESKASEIQSYIKAQELKIKKTLDFIRKTIDGSERRKDYYEVGRAEDEIALAELEYKLAKEKGDDSNLKKYLDKVESAKSDAQKKAEELGSDIKKDGDKESAEAQIVLDPEKEKKKIGSRKVRDVVKRKNELSREIIDLKEEMVAKLKSLKRKVDSKTLKKTQVKNLMLDLLELSSALDAKRNLLKLLTGLGKSQDEISSNLQSETEFTKLANKINQSITDGQDANTGTKKIIAGVFSNATREGSANISSDKINDAIEKINK
jgi:hypothetical protein